MKEIIELEKSFLLMPEEDWPEDGTVFIFPSDKFRYVIAEMADKGARCIGTAMDIRHARIFAGAYMDAEFFKVNSSSRDKYEEIRALTADDRREILEFAMKRSEEILR